MANDVLAPQPGYFASFAPSLLPNPVQMLHCWYLARYAKTILTPQIKNKA